MERVPGMKNKLFNRLATAERGWEDIKGAEGIQGGASAKARLHELKRTMESA
jgi:hypothetical protein